MIRQVNAPDGGLVFNFGMNVRWAAVRSGFKGVCVGSALLGGVLGLSGCGAVSSPVDAASHSATAEPRLGSTVPTVSLSVGLTTFSLNQPPAATVTVSCGTACGQVDFRVDGNEWGTVSLGASGTFMTSGFPTVAAGVHTLQVFYLGNATYAAASSNAISLTVVASGAAIPTVSLSLAATTFSLNQPPAATVAVSCASACGQVDFRVDGNEWGTVSLGNGGTFTTSGFPAVANGAHTLQVFYLGNAVYAPASSNVMNVTVTSAVGSTVPTVGLSFAATTFSMNQPPPATVSVSCASACGQVDFRVDGNEWGTVLLGAGGTFTTSGFPAVSSGTHAVQVFYLGNGSYAAAASNVVNVTVSGIGVTVPTIQLSVPTTSFSLTQPSPATVSVSCGSSCGDVDFRVDGNEWATVALGNGGTFITSGFPAVTNGAHTVQAFYLGNASYAPASSNVVNVTVFGVAPQITLTGGGQVRLGTTLQLTASVFNLTNQALTWQVNGVTGGSTTVGTISTAGLYTPPAVIPANNTVTVSAVSVASPTVNGTASVTVLNPIPVVTSATVTVQPSATTGLLDVIGTGFVSGAILQSAGTSATTTFVSSTELQATVPVTVGVTTLVVGVINPNPGSVTTTAIAPVSFLLASLPSSARLLDQATFGPTLTDISHVETVGLQGYLTEQFAVPATIEPDIPATPPVLCTTNLIPCQQAEWWQAAVTAPDQLRQRVAFALSEMFVISTNSVNSHAVIAFQNTLVNDAFSNFSTIMKDVSVSPGMGAYLNMLNSAKPATINGVPQIANENYSRELMQLFTTGIDLLNADGSLQLDGNGNPIPVYTEDQVQAFARAYTGWTYATATGGSSTSYPNYTANYIMPMAAVESQHDMTSTKILLNGTTLPAGQTAEVDLAGALNNIFNHPNVGPFVCRQLIQHLVASSPSPAYVARISAVFANNGKGVRGDMKAVVQAILLDQDARAGDTSTSFDGGHLREPMLYMTNLVRGLSFSFTGGGTGTGNEYYSTLSNYTSALSQKPYTSGSVFNFFPPNYVIPATTTNAPEFSIENTASAVLRLTLADNVVYNRISAFSVDLSATGALGITASKTGNATTDSGNLVDALGTIFMHGQMPSQMRSTIVNHVATLTNIPQRVRVATYLVITASYYKVEH